MVVDREILPFQEWLLFGPQGFGALPIFIFMLAAGSLLAMVVCYAITAITQGPVEAFYIVAQVVAGAIPDFFKTAPRRVWAMTRFAIQESIRRKVLIGLVVFAILLLYAGWFLDNSTDHPARLYLSFAMTTTSYLVLLLGLFLSTFSLPNDIKNRTMYTVVTKPVRPLEIVVGRIFGFSVVGTFILALMALVSYGFVVRNLSHRHELDDSSTAKINAAIASGKPWEGVTTMSRSHRHKLRIDPTQIAKDGRVATDLVQEHWHVVEKKGEGANAKYVVGPPQGQLQARVPVYGRLDFLTRSGGQAVKGINVGDEWAYRSYVEGGTLAAAIWKFEGITKDRFPSGLPIELNIGIFRTHKGNIEKGVMGTLYVKSPNKNARISSSTPFNFYAKEFVIDRQFIPRQLQAIDSETNQIKDIDLFDLAQDGKLELWLQCADRGQYFGMAQADVYLRAADRSFFLNFCKGYVGIWLQMVLIIALGVLFSTFLSGPIAMLTTVGAIILGEFSPFIQETFFGVIKFNNVFNEFLGVGINENEVNPGGGPIESLIRLLTQKNLQQDLDMQWIAEAIIKWTDFVLMTMMWAVSKALPDFSYFDSGRYVAEGFNIAANLISQQCVVTIGYVFVLSLIGYFSENTGNRGMNRNISFVRKAVYGGLIILLLVPLFQLGQPSSYSRGQQVGGGVLAKLRNQHNLAQASLGEIDPASESMKLATLGMRGVAANILWTKAQEYQRTKNWDALSATLNQITKLQPNFIKVWEYQSHNLSYNVSVEFDDYRHRYEWVKKGINFLIGGTEYNREEARLFNMVGWIFGQKMGRADEHLQFRRLFRQDRDYHEFLDSHNYVDMENPEVRSRYDQLPDNWLVARQWFIKAETIVENSIHPLRGKSPLVFYSDKPKTLINSAEAAEDEGHFGEPARAAWSDALASWKKFGDRQIPSSWGINLLLNDYTRSEETENELEKQLSDLAPGGRDAILKEKRAKLTPEELDVVDKTDYEIMLSSSQELVELYMQARSKTFVSDQEILDRVPSESKERARRLGRKLAAARTMLAHLKSYRNQVNFEYWQTRCEAEQTTEATDARQYLYDAEDLFKSTKLEEAKENYEKAWDLWYAILVRYPILRDDLSSDTLKGGMTGFMETLAQLGEEPKPDFLQKWEWIMRGKDPNQPMGGDYAPTGSSN